MSVSVGKAVVTATLGLTLSLMFYVVVVHGLMMLV